MREERAPDRDLHEASGFLKIPLWLEKYKLFHQNRRLNQRSYFSPHLDGFGTDYAPLLAPKIAPK